MTPLSRGSVTPLSIFAAVTVLCTVLDIHVVQYSTVLYSTVQYCTVLYYVQYCSTAIWHYLTWDRATLVALSLHYSAVVFDGLSSCSGHKVDSSDDEIFDWIWDQLQGPLSPAHVVTGSHPPFSFG